MKGPLILVYCKLCCWAWSNLLMKVETGPTRSQPSITCMLIVFCVQAIARMKESVGSEKELKVDFLN